MAAQEVLLQRYIGLRQAGDQPGALAAAREACAAAPDEPAVHYALGEALSAVADYAGAVQAFAVVLRRAPAWADAWVNLGLALYRQGSVDGAKMAMREALRAQPGHPAAASNLGALMRITGEAAGGEGLLRQALAQAPDNAAARLNLAAELLQRECGAEALTVLDESTSLPSDLAALRHWHLTRAAALLQIGDAAAAGAAMAAFTAVGCVPPELAPLWHWRRVLLAQLMGDQGAARAAAAEMAAAIPEMGPNAVPEHRILAHYDLAKFWSGQGDRSAAFMHWGEGHRLLRLSQPFSREAFARFLEDTKAAFEANRFRAGAFASNQDPAPVFIIGMPRSGTTLCEEILAAHARVHGAGERTALQHMAQMLGTPAQIAALPAEALDGAAARYLAGLHALAPGKARIVDKMPGNEMYLGLAALMLPGAKFIHCVRDPRDIGLSIWTYRFHGEHSYAHDLADLGWTIGQRAKLVEHWHRVLPGRILTVALRDWVDDFDGTLARVLGHLDLPHDPACARFHENNRDVRTVSRAQVRQPVHARGLGRWRAYAAELAPLIAELNAAGMLDTP